MKLVQIHPLSLVVGAALFSLGSLLVGAQQTPTVSGAPTDDRTFAEVPITLSGPVQVEGVPTPQQMMRIDEGSPFMVPAGKIFVATGTGFTNSPPGQHQALVEFDNTSVLNNQADSGRPTTMAIPPGLVAHEGTVVRVSGNASNPAVLLGYLADA